MTTPDPRSLLMRAKNRLQSRPAPSAGPAASTPGATTDLDLLMSTPLFDVEWYASIAGCAADRATAALHYLQQGHREGLSPHPLFDPVHYTRRLGEEYDGRPPFLVYLGRLGSTRPAPGPLFDTVAYAKANKAALRHPHGLLGHYLLEGRAAGARPNDWFDPGGPTDFESLADWVKARRAEWRARQEGPPGKQVVDWDSLAARSPSSSTVSVLMVTQDEFRMTTQAVGCVAAAAATSDAVVEIVVLANGSGPVTAVMLDSLPARFAGVSVIHTALDHGPTLGRNLAISHATGGIAVFLDHDTEVTPGWLDPLLEALQDPDVLGAQALLVGFTGPVASAGVAFPSCGGIPHLLLRGFPREDAAGLESASFAAVSSGALAMRACDVVALQGFDPLFQQSLVDVDLGLRMGRFRPGRFTVRPDSVVVHRESNAPSTDRLTDDRRLLLERWGTDMPGDDLRLWRHVGYEVLGHRLLESEGSAEPSPDRRVEPPAPVLARRAAVAVTERPLALRWALKNPAPAVTAERWGDTHFVRRLASALRRLGQEVVIDNWPEFHRPTTCHDDVALAVRGLQPHFPAYGQVNLLWLISHPELLARSEAASHDRVFAAGAVWAERMSREWGIRIDPLLQATDPELFHPDRARPDTGHPVLFVGGSFRRQRPLILAAVEQDLPLSVYGRDWKSRIPGRFIKATSLPNEEAGIAYRSAGVVLNDHWEEMRVDGFISNRLFDAAAAGARVITDDVAGLGRIFGRSVQVVRDLSELSVLACAPNLDAIYGDDRERREVAARIHAEHSFDVRARVLLDAALEIRSGLSASRRRG